MEVHSIGQSDWHVEVGLLRKEVGLLKQWACMEETRRIERQKMEMYGEERQQQDYQYLEINREKVLKEVERDRLERMKMEEKKELAKINQMKDEELLLMDIRMREREREMEEERRRFKKTSERQKVEKRMELQKKRQKERDEWEISENKRMEEWEEFYWKEEDIRKEEGGMKAERKAKRMVEEGKRKMGEEQQMLKKQARLTETLSDGKRRDLEERKEDENNMGEKCVEEARERDRRELLKEKRWRQIAEENLTHMEKQMMEREGERKRELECQIREEMRKREEERKHEEEMKMRKLEEDLMKEKRQRQIAEENMTHMEKQMRELEEREEEKKREFESQIREEKRKHEEEMKMRKLEDMKNEMFGKMRELEERKRELESQIKEEERKHEEEMKMRKLEDMKNEMFGKLRELEERMIKMEKQHAANTMMEEENEERKRVEDTARMKELKKTALDVWEFHFGSDECPKTDDSKNEETPDSDTAIVKTTKKVEKENSADEKKDNSVGVRQDSDTSVIEEINPKHEERDGDQDDDSKSDGKKYRSDAECSDGDDSKSAKTHQKKTDKEKNETMEALLTEEKGNSSDDDDDDFTEMKQKDGHKNMLVEEKVATNYCQNNQPSEVKVQNDLAGDMDWSESDYSEIEEIIDGDTEDISEEIKETDEEEEVEENTDIESDERTGRNVIRSECDDDKSGKPNMKKDMVDKDNTDNNVEKDKTTQSNTKREEGERKEGQSQDTETYKTNGATESDELTLAPGKGADSNDSESVKSNKEKEKDDQKDKGQLESQEEKKEDRILAGAEGETQHPQEDQSEMCKDFSIFAATTVKIQGPGEDQLAIEGKTNDSQTDQADQAAKVKGEKDLDIDWSENDSETEEMTSDFEIDEETDQPATCGDYSISVTAEVNKTQDPDKDQPAKLKDLSVLAAAGGKTQDSAKVKGEKDLDINVDWSETDYSCSDDEFTSEEIYPMDEEKGLLQLQTDGNTNEIGGETTDSDDFQRHRINSEKDEKDGYEKKEVVQENQRAKCKDFSIFSAGAQVTHSQCKDLSGFSAARDKFKGENDLDRDWLESDNSEIEEVIESDSEIKEIHQIEERKEKDEEQTDDLQSKRKTEKCDEETTDSSDDKSEKTNVKIDKEMRHEDITDHTLEKTDFSIFAEEEVKPQDPREDQPAKCKAGGKTQNTQTDQATKVKGEQDLDIDTDWSESDLDSDDEFITEEVWQKWKEDNEKKRQNKDYTVTPLRNTDRIDGEISREKIGKINQEQRAAAEGKNQNPQTYQPVKVKGENDLTSAGMNQEKTEIEVVQRSRQEQPAKCKVPPVQQAKVSNKSEIVQKRDGNDKVTEPKTDAELIMEKYERMVEEGRRGLGQKDRRGKVKANGTEGKKKEESKEEQRRLRNEKALQDHLDRVENQEGTSKQTRQPQCKDYSIFTASGLKSKDPHDQQPVKCKDYSIFSVGQQRVAQPPPAHKNKTTSHRKDVSIFAAGKNHLAKVLKPLVCKKAECIVPDVFLAKK
ncbi:trichohyalin isoform X1 [Salmo salar]|uniref:Trichohyalin-like isoform X1 n=1 Tax=Salmo salar TaxID=8030 RepID=A0ABM3DUC9_SALSA|nr:trichohyalin-like isoform X1 [Salmo salar]XP_045562413.1 trichohyalin-like isoform X1 [Salmo salar]XP_045562414.1 trichohyalin-like isoform X1 [Salmo salar]